VAAVAAVTPLPTAALWRNLIPFARRNDNPRAGRNAMSVRTTAFRASLLAATFATPAFAADVTRERLVNADKEPNNWLTNHRTYDGHRYSTLDKVNKQTVKGLRMAYAVALGGSAVGENLEATPLAEDGFLYIVDEYNIVYKIDGRSGDMGRIVWRMDPGVDKPPQFSNRGVALWGNYVVSVAEWPSRVFAIDKDTGKVAWETNLQDQPTVELTAAPLVVGDKVLVGAAGGDRGTRDWLAALDAKTGKLVWKKFIVPAPGEPGSETWKDKNNAWETGGGALGTTGTHDPDSNQVFWGTGNPVPMFDPTYRPGDNLYTNSVISWNPDDGRMNWYHQYTPGDGWDYDAISSEIIIDAVVNGQTRRLLTQSNRNGFVYTMEAANGQSLLAKPYTEVNWTKGIDQKTGLPVEYVPNADRQMYAGAATATLEHNNVKQCPNPSGGNNFWPTSYSRRTKLIYIPADTTCSQLKLDPSLSNPAGVWKGGVSTISERVEGDLVAFDPLSGEVKKKFHSPFASHSGTLATAGGLVFSAYSDGTLAAYDDETLDVKWKFNMGSGVTAPPMTFGVGDKQYVAIATGLSRIARGTLQKAPETKEMRNSTVLYVFTVD
jgi:alcohol dehydrogenase (cytochrome c)